MRTNIEIDDELMRQAMEATGARTKKDAVEASMRLAVRLKGQEEILKWFGKIQWDGDLAVSREGRFLDWEVHPQQSETEPEAAPPAVLVP